MGDSLTLKQKTMRIADDTAYSVHNLLGVDKTNAIDTYEIAKKMGVLKGNKIENNSSIYLRNKKEPNVARYEWARDIAKFIVAASNPKANTKGMLYQETIDELAASLIMPKKETLIIYNYLNAKGVDENKIARVLATRYGISESIAIKRLKFLVEEDKKYVLKKEKREQK